METKTMQHACAYWAISRQIDDSGPALIIDLPGCLPMDVMDERQQPYFQLTPFSLTLALGSWCSKYDARLPHEQVDFLVGTDNRLYEIENSCVAGSSVHPGSISRGKTNTLSSLFNGLRELSWIHLNGVTSCEESVGIIQGAHALLNTYRPIVTFVQSSVPVQNKQVIDVLLHLGYRFFDAKLTPMHYSETLQTATELVVAVHKGEPKKRVDITSQILPDKPANLYGSVIAKLKTIVPKYRDEWKTSGTLLCLASGESKTYCLSKLSHVGLVTYKEREGYFASSGAHVSILIPVQQAGVYEICLPIKANQNNHANINGHLFSQDLLLAAGETNKTAFTGQVTLPAEIFCGYILVHFVLSKHQDSGDLSVEPVVELETINLAYLGAS